MSVADFLRVAQAEVGYVEGGGPDGRSGNITKYWQELQPDFQGASWCAAFVSWVAKHAGHPLPAIDHPWGYSYCPDLVTYAKQHGLWDTSGHYAPGDIILFSWPKDGVADHTGIVVSDNGSVVSTIEGNTSGTNNGSQSNGGGVYRRERPHNATILGVFKWSKVLGGDAAMPPHNPPQPQPKTAMAGKDRWLGVYNPPCTGQDVINVQNALNSCGNSLPLSGVYDNHTAAVVKVFQDHRNISERGVGPKTWAALRTAVHG